MSWNISKKELESVLTSTGDKRYAYFIKKVVDWEEVWSLRSNNGWVLASDFTGIEVVPVWPHKRFAQVCVEDNWQNSQPDVIKISEWVTRWIPGMIKDERQVAVFPTPHDKGVIVSPERLRVDISNESKQYEL